jgi:hypothetical protein
LIKHNKDQVSVVLRTLKTCHGRIRVVGNLVDDVLSGSVDLDAYKLHTKTMSLLPVDYGISD